MIHMINTPPWVDSIRRNFDFIKKHLLPHVDAEDDGKVLSVVDGEWTPSEGGGSGGGVFAVGMTEDAMTGDIILDKTAGEIIEALQNKQMVALYVDQYEDLGAIEFDPLFLVSTSGAGIEFLFATTHEGEFTPVVFTAATEDDYPAFVVPDGGDG